MLNFFNFLTFKWQFSGVGGQISVESVSTDEDPAPGEKKWEKVKYLSELRKKVNYLLELRKKVNYLFEFSPILEFYQNATKSAPLAKKGKAQGA